MNEIKQRFLNSRNWLALVEDLEREIELIEDPTEKARRLHSLGQVYEDLLLLKDRALAAYQQAFKEHHTDPVPLNRARLIYHEMGKLSMVAKLMEYEAKLAEDPRQHVALMVQLAAYSIDLGRRERALELLEMARSESPDDPGVLELAQVLGYQPGNWDQHVAVLVEAAFEVSQQSVVAGARLFLNAARVVALEAPEDPRQEDLLRQALELDPEQEDANYLLEELLAKDRPDELKALHMVRLEKASPERQVELNRSLALFWTVRQEDQATAAMFFTRALQDFYSGESGPYPGHIAALRILRQAAADRGGDWGPLLAMAEGAMEGPLTVEDHALVAAEAGDIAFRELMEPHRAAEFFAFVHKASPDNPLLAEFMQQHGELIVPPEPQFEDTPTGVDDDQPGLEFEAGPQTDPGVSVEAEFEVAAGDEEVYVATEPEPEEAAPADTEAAMDSALDDDQQSEEDQQDVEPESEPEEVVELEAEPEPEAEPEDIVELEPEPEPEPEPVALAVNVEAVPDEVDEQLDEATAALCEQAARAEAESPERGIDAWRKVAQRARQARTPRRALARLYAGVERWNALVEVLKEEVELVAEAGGKIALLQQMVQIYRDRLGLDVMVVSGLNQILQLDPSRVDVLEALAVQYEKMKRWTDLISTLRKKAEAVSDAAQQVAIWSQVANLFLERFSNQAEAIKAFERVIELDPTHSEALERLKGMYERRRDWDKLIGIYKREIDQLDDLDERRRRTIEVAQLAATKLKRPSISQELWGQVLVVDPENLEALKELETLYERAKDWAKLADICQRQVGLTEDTQRKTQLLQKLALLLSDKLGQSQQAIEAWRELLQYDPANRRAQDTLKKLYISSRDYAALEQFYAAQNKWDEFIRVLERQVDTEEPEARVQLSFKIADLWQERMNKPDRAARAYEKILSIEESNLQAAEALIPIYAQGRDVRKYARVLEIQLENTQEPEQKLERIRTLAELHEQKLRDSEQALKLLLQALATDPRVEWVREDAERLAGGAGRWTELVSAYEQAQQDLVEPVDRLPLMSTVARIYETELASVEDALRVNNEILELEPGNMAALEALVRLYSRTEQWSELLQIFDRKIEQEQDPDERKELYLRMATLYEEEIGDPDRAIDAYRTVLDLAGEDSQALRALDRLYQAQRMWAELAEVLLRELNLTTGEDLQEVVGLKFRLGSLYHDRLDDLAGALDCYREILELQAGHDGARAALERLLDDADHQQEAARILEPIYTELGEWQRLIDVHEIELAHQGDPPARVDLLLRVGNLLVEKMGDGDRAFEAFARCFKEEPTNEVARQELERLAEIQDSWEELAGLYEAATAEAIDASLQLSLLQRLGAIADERLEQPERAVAFYQQAHELDPDNAESLQALETLFSGAERWRDLLDVYRRQAQLTEDPAEREDLHFRMATLWEEMEGNLEEAVDTYREILINNDANVQALKALDRIYQLQQNWAELADNLSRQLELTDDQAMTVELLLRLAQLRREDLGETEAAVETYRRVLDLEPDNRDAVEALEGLIDDAELQQNVAQILRPIYQQTGEWQKLVGIYEILVNHSYDPAEKIDLLQRIGELYEIGDDPGSAFAAYGRALKEDPSQQESLDRLEKLARVLDNYEELVALLNGLVAEVMDEELVAALHLKVAAIYEHNLNDLQQAAGAYKQLLAVDPQNAEAIGALEQIYIRADSHQELVQVLLQQAEITLEPEERKGILFRAAQIYEDLLENSDEAIRVYQMVLDLDDSDATAMDALERLYLGLERWESLKDLYLRKVELATEVEEKKEIFSRMGVIFEEQLGDLDQAIECYTNLLELDPEDLAAVAALDGLYQQGERWYDLLQILERQVELAGNTSAEAIEHRHRIGKLWQRELGDLTRAVETYREVLAIEPNHEPTIMALDGLAHGEEEAVLAAQVLEPIYEQTFEWEKLIDLLEVMVQHSDDPLQTVELLKRIAALYEEQQGDGGRAFEAFSRAFRQEGADDSVMDQLERLAHQIGAWEQLAGLFEAEQERVLDADRQVLLALKLGRIHDEELQQPDQAIAKYCQALELDSDCRPAIMALDLLYTQGEHWGPLADILRREIQIAEAAEDIVSLQFRLGQLYQEQLGDVQNAIDCYRDILAGSPDHGPSITSLELLLEEDEHQAVVAEILEPLYSAGDQWAQLVHIMEIQLRREQDLFDQVQIIQRIAEICEQRMGDHSQAFEWWGNAFALDPVSEVASQELERLAAIVDGWEDLVSIYGGALEAMQPEDRKRVLMMMARVHEEALFDRGRAEEAFLSVLQIDELDPAALEALDRIYTQTSTFEALAAILKRRIAICDETGELVGLQLRLGETLEVALEDAAGAVEAYTSVLDLESRNVRALDALERLYFKGERWAELLDIYERMIDVAEGDAGVADCYARMAKIASDALDDRDRAMDLWNRVLDLRGEDPVALWALADLYEASGEWEQLVEVLERQVRIVEQPEDQIRLQKRLGRIWAEKLQRDRNALEAWFKVMELDPGDTEALYAVAEIYRKGEAWEELSQTLHRLIDLGTASEMPEQELAALYTQLGRLEGEIMLRPDEAVEAWRKVLQMMPADGQALAALEQLLTQEARWEECIQVLMRKAEIQPETGAKIDVLLQAAGIWQEKLENPDSAAGIYEQILELDPDHEDAFSAVHALYQEGDHWNKLRDLLFTKAELVKESARKVELFQELAGVFEEKLDAPDNAFVVLQAAFKEDYTNDDTAENFERLARATGKWNDLLAEYRAVVESIQDPKVKSDLMVKMGKWYGTELGHMDWAIASLTEALKINPECVQAMVVLERFHRQAGEWQELVKIMKRHADLETDPERQVELLLGLAELYEDQLAEQALAISSYRKALEIDPVNGDALKALERLYRNIEQWDSLIEILERKAEATDEAEQIIDLRRRIGQLYTDELGDDDRAIACYQAILDIDPENLGALRALEALYERTDQGEAYIQVLERQLDISTSTEDQVSLYQRMALVWEEKRGKPEQAAECLEKLLEIAPEDDATYKSLERLYRESGRFTDLVDTLMKHVGAVSDPTERVELYMAMGKVYETNLQDVDRAIESFNDVLSFDPDQTHALDALARLFEQIEDWDRAVDTMRRLIELVDDAPYRVGILFRLGCICEEHHGDPAGAEEYYAQVLGIDPTHVGAMSHLTTLYKLRGDWAKAASMMERTVAHSSNTLEKARMLYEAGAAYLQQLGDEGRAADLFALTLEVDPDHQQAGEPLANLYFRDEQYEELEPILDMLIRKADRRDNRLMQDLYYKLARTCDGLGNNDKALKYYRAAYDIDSTHLETLSGMADLLFRQEDWDRAFKIFQTILVHHRDSQASAQIVDIYYRLGTIKLKLGERKKALNMYEKALELDGTHRQTLEAVIELQRSQGDWEAVINAKRNLLPVADEDERFKLLTECGEVYREKLNNLQKSISFFQDALEIKPDSHVVLHELLEAFYESKQWKSAVEILTKLAEMEQDAERRSKYIYTAAVIFRDEIKSLDEAQAYFNRALDDNPGLLKAFEAIDRLSTTQRNWKELERNYRKMLKRLPQEGQNGLKVMLWHNLGEIYRTRLKDFKSACTAFEVATSMDPNNLQRHEILAELYMLSGPEFAAKAVGTHQILIQSSPFKFESYKALRRIYMDTRQYDKAWSLCSTLSFLKKADAEEQQFYEQYRQKGFVRAQARITDELWHSNIYHQEEDRFISAILATVSPVVAAMTARPHKQFRLKRKERRDLATDQLLFSKVFAYVTSVLGVVQAELYLRPDQQTGLVMAHTTEVPSFVVGSDLLQGRPEKELAFAAAKQLCFLRPEHFLRNVLGAPSQLKTVFFAALKLVDSNFPIAPADVPAVDKTVKYMAGKLHPSQAEALTGLVRKFATTKAEVDLNRWWTATELSANRAGFILCNDLEVAAKMVSTEPSGIGAMTPKEKVKDLVLYSISEDYFRVRRQLGMTIGQ